MPYRSAAAVVVPRSIEDLFAAAAPLRAGDELSLDYDVLPWKRIVVTLRYRPPSLSAFIRSLRTRFDLTIRVLRSEYLPEARYSVAPERALLVRPDLADMEGGSPTWPLDELGTVAKARVQVGNGVIQLADGIVSFGVSGYDGVALAHHFEALYRDVLKDVPALTDREWQRVRP